jgi:hypothetical protein
MRRSALSALVVCFFAALLLLANPKPPLSVVVSPASQTVKSGADVKLKVTVSNTSSHELVFFDRVRICDYPIKIRDADGNEPPETADKQQSRCDRKPGQLDEARNILIRLNPGDSVDDEITVSFYYDVRRTGTYTVQVSRHLPAEISKEDIPSNSVTFVVTE